MLETSLSRGELILLVVCGVTLGNLMTLLLIVGWRGFLHGRPPTFRSAPIWSYIAIFLGSLFPLLALLALLDAGLTALWKQAPGRIRPARPAALAKARLSSIWWWPLQP